MAEISFPFFTVLQGYVSAAGISVPSAATASVTFQHRSLTISGDRIVENIAGAGMSRGTKDLPTGSGGKLFVIDGQLYVERGGKVYAVWLWHSPQIIQSSIAWTHPGQRVLSDPTGAKRFTINRGRGFWAGTLRIAGFPDYVDSNYYLSGSYESFFALLDQQDNWAKIPLGRFTEGSALSTFPGKYFKGNTTNRLYIQNEGGTYWPYIADAGGYAATAIVRAQAASARPVLSRRSGQGFDDWTFGWVEYLGA